MKIPVKKQLLLLLFLALFSVSLRAVIQERAQASVLKADVWETEDFRSQELSPSLFDQLAKAAASASDFSGILAATMLAGDFSPETISRNAQPYLRYKPEDFYQLQAYYEAIWCDVVCFPVAGRDEISYENTYGAPRSYGGDRTHEGTDLFGERNVSGYYPVLSMTDGVVEKIGWLPLGGYRIGIRAPRGAYFYYAHLSQYDREFQVGETVRAGDILGFMGSTGYGEEGTAGQFPVHLHLGIYIQTENFAELSVNPYWVLRTAEKNMKNYSY